MSKRLISERESLFSLIGIAVAVWMWKDGGLTAKEALGAVSVIVGAFNASRGLAKFGTVEREQR